MKSLSRVYHKTAEKLTSADVTEYDGDIKKMINDAKVLEEKTKMLIDSYECFIQPNPKLRLNESLMDAMKRSKERVSVLQEFGQSVKDVGEAVDESSPLKDHFKRSGIAIKLCGQKENTFVGNSVSKFLKPNQDYMENIINPFNAAKKKLENIRVDYDAALAKQKKAADDISKNQNDKTKMAKSKADTDVQNIKDQFDKQCGIVRNLGTKILDTKQYASNLKNLMAELVDFHSYCVKTLESMSDDPNEKK